MQNESTIKIKFILLLQNRAVGMSRRVDTDCVDLGQRRGTKHLGQPSVNGGKMDIISESMKNSSYWTRIEICRLTQNMRANEDVEYANWILSLGENKLPKRDHDLVELRKDLILRHQSLEDFVFPVMINQHNSDQFMQNIILSARNSSCDRFNKRILYGRVEGDMKIYYSIDSLERSPDDELNFPLEFLNSINDPSLPPHKLELKVGAIIMLMRNLDKSNGLCNGTRLTVIALHEEIIITRKSDSTGHVGQESIAIPRCDLTAEPGNYPFKMKRRQFPLKLAFSCTINKAQGQTFNRVGIDLSMPVFLLDNYM